MPIKMLIIRLSIGCIVILTGFGWTLSKTTHAQPLHLHSHPASDSIPRQSSSLHKTQMPIRFTLQAQHVSDQDDEIFIRYELNLQSVMKVKHLTLSMKVHPLIQLDHFNHRIDALESNHTYTIRSILRIPRSNLLLWVKQAKFTLMMNVDAQITTGVKVHQTYLLMPNTIDKILNHPPEEWLKLSFVKHQDFDLYHSKASSKRQPLNRSRRDDSLRVRSAPARKE